MSDGERRLHRDDLARPGVRQRQLRRMQRRPSQLRVELPARIPQVPPAALAVARVDEQRMADGGQVGPDLVGASGHELEPEPRRLTEGLDGRVPRQGGPAALRVHLARARRAPAA